VILREDRTNVDHLGDVWAVPLAEARLSTFLAAARDGTTTDTDDGPDAFIAGAISDAQAKWNLNRLIVIGGSAPIIDTNELTALERLTTSAGAPGDTAQVIANGMLAAITGAPNATLMPRTIDQLAWLGLASETIELLRPHVTILPGQTTININTASRDVIAAAIPNMTSGTAQAVVEARQRTPFQSVNEVITQGLVPPLQATGTPPVTPMAPFDVRSSFFEVRGRIRLDEHVLEEMSIVQRTGQQGQRAQNVIVIQRQRVSTLDSGKS
jgi:general secretion pathway protein K